MKIFDRFRKNPQKKPAAPVEKPDLRDTVGPGTGVRVSTTANDGSRLAVIKTWFINGRQPKTGFIEVEESFDSYVSRNGIYDNEKIHGWIDIAALSENGAKTIRVLSFTKNVIEVGISVSVRIPGQELNGTVRTDVVLDGEATKLEGLIGGSESKEQIRDDVLYEKYITARELQDIVNESIVDITSRTVNFANVYESIEEIDKELGNKITNHMWFMDRGLSVRSVFIRFEMSELEKIQDKLVRIRYMTMDQKAELEGKKAAVKIAEENKNLMGSVDSTPEGDASSDTGSPKGPEQI